MKRSPLLRRTPLRTVDQCADCGAGISKGSSGRCKRCANALNGAKGAAVMRSRRIEIRGTCAHCGETFTTRRSRPVRFCSQKCMGEAKRKPRVCVVCGAEFWARSIRAKTCSRECLHERKRAIGRDKGKPHPTGNTKKVWFTARGTQCEVCAATRGLHFHHVTYEQHLRIYGGDPYDPRNGMTVCQRCHRRHHDAVERIPLPSVPDAALAFAVDLFGDDLKAAQYLARFYAPEIAEGEGVWQP